MALGVLLHPQLYLVYCSISKAIIVPKTFLQIENKKNAKYFIYFAIPVNVTLSFNHLTGQIETSFSQLKNPKVYYFELKFYIYVASTKLISKFHIPARKYLSKIGISTGNLDYFQRL